MHLAERQGFESMPSSLTLMLPGVRCRSHPSWHLY